jgi:hypothetical protein
MFRSFNRRDPKTLDSRDINYFATAGAPGFSIYHPRSTLDTQSVYTEIPQEFFMQEINKLKEENVYLKGYLEQINISVIQYSLQYYHKLNLFIIF